MSRPVRIVRNIAIGLAALVIALVIAALIITQTQWFRNYVREKIIALTEESTGGRVDVQSFSFSPRALEAVVTGFVIHGKEPAGAAPFIQIPRLQLDLRLFTSIHHLWDITYLGVTSPSANVIVLPDGSTNIPQPKQKSQSNETPLETVVDLAIGRFELTNGLATVADQKQALDLRGNNLRAQLLYNALNQGYTGQLSFQPLYVVSGHNTPVNFTVSLPVALQRDRIQINNAHIASALSDIVLNGGLEHLNNPNIAAHINGRVALADLKNLANLPVETGERGLPSALDLDANATVAPNSIQVAGLHLSLGQSTLEGSGPLKTPNGNGGLQFKGNLALGELGRLVQLMARPEGTVFLNGIAKLDANNNYQVTGNVQANRLSFQQGAERIGNVNLYSAVRLDPHTIDLEGLRLSAFGGELTGNASLQDFAAYRLDAAIRSFDIRTLARIAGQKQLPYDGIISGPIEVAGDLKAPAALKTVTADARLTITPGRAGIPVSGRLYAAYDGASDDIRVENSYIALPHTRLTVNGSVGRQLNVDLTSTNLNDLLAATSTRPSPVAFANGGQANLTGTVMGSLTAPRIAAHITATRFIVEGRQFDQLSAGAAASKAGATIRDASITRGTMRIEASGSVGLRDWKPLPREPLNAIATVRDADLADLVALAGQPSAGYSGMLGANLAVRGTVGNPTGGAGLLITKAMIDGEPVDRAEAQLTLADRLATLSNAYIVSGPARIDINGTFAHPRDSFTTGRIQAHLDTTQLDLAQLRPLENQLPNTSGMVRMNADLTADLSESKTNTPPKTEFLLTSVNADASIRGLRSEGQNYGDLNLTARTAGQTVQYYLNSDFAGSTIRVNGNTQLTRGYATNADAILANLPVQRLLALAHRTDIAVKGNLSGTAHFAGTTENPQGNVNLDLANAVVDDQPVDHMRAQATYLARSIDIPRFEIVSGPARIDLSAHYDHPAGNLEAGQLQFNANSSSIDLARIKPLQERRPGLGGMVQLAAKGAADVRESEPRVLPRDLDANIKATGLTAEGKNLGDLALTANTSGGRVNFALDSNLAGAAIHGRGNTQLTATYPTEAQLTFDDVTWTRIQNLLGSGNGQAPSFDAFAQGQVSVRGPLVNMADLTGSLQVTRIQVTALSRTTGTNTATGNMVLLQNEGPISATLDHGIVRIASAHLTGPQTDFQATGTVPLEGQAMNVSVNGNLNLAILQRFSRDITSSGSIVLTAAAQGTVSAPLVNGRLELHNASLNYGDIPNGLSNANGVIQISGNSASITSLTAQSGGGNIRVRGFAALRPDVRFALRADASNLRVLVQQGASIVAGATINLSGTLQNSEIGGTVTIDQVSYAPQTDIGGILTRAAPQVVNPTPSTLLDNMKLDIHVVSSPALAVQASLAENLQINTDLRVRGTASRPDVLGRVTVTEGQLVFFGTTYTVNTGTIGFYNPVRIEPVLDLSLQTEAQGVTVTVRVTGPIDNMKLSYSSDPPLQFQEIVSLLAAGTTPTSDPTILANQPPQPQQSFMQMGESAVLGAAVANPVSSRLQRVFGVSQLKIAPTFTNGSQLPTAQVSLQQRIADNITFTYVTALNDPNAQTIQVEMALSPQWSAQAIRDYNGIFSINLLYKKQFR